MPTFALLDVVTPYVVGGAAIGEPLHELLSALFVTEVETSFDDNGVCIAGIARFSADVGNLIPTYTPPATITWNPNATVDHNTQRTAGAYWDFPDIAITFRLTAPRASSPVADLVVSGGPGGAPAPLNSVALTTLLAGLGQGQPLPGQLAADSVDTLFHLDLLIDAATLHLPFLTGALLQADGMLAADPANSEVTLTLPKIKLSLEQNAGSTAGGVTDPVMALNFDSWAAHDIGDPAGAGYGELLRMQPPYALFGPGDVLGFGFNSVILDLSGTETPPALLDKFGVGDDFRGIYFPDVRVFAKPPGLTGGGVDISARELLLGLGPEGGISGVFGVDVVKKDAAQAAIISIYDEFGGLVDRVELPEIVSMPAPLFVSDVLPVPRKSQWIVDVTGGQPPYSINVDGQQQTADPVVITLASGTSARTVPINILDVHAGGQSRRADIRVALLPPSLTAPDGGTSSQAEKAVLTVLVAGPPGFGITMLDAPAQEQVTILFTPDDATATVAVGGGGAQPLTIKNGRASMPLAHGASIDIAASWTEAATPANAPVTFNAQFQYDQPRPVPNKSPQDPDDAAWSAFAADSDRIRTIRSKDEPDPNGGWKEADKILRGSAALTKFVEAAKASSGTTITLVGEASKEKVPLEGYNLELSQRRIWAVRELLRQELVTNVIDELPEGEQPPTDPYLAPGRAEYRRVDATILTGGSPGGVRHASVRIARPPRKSVPVPVKPPVIKREAPDTDAIRFKELHVRMQLDHNRLIALELRLKVDIETVLEHYLTTVKQQNPVPAAGQGPTRLPVGKLSDPNDGELDMRIQITLDDTVGRWQVLASLFENDSDGFLQTPPPVQIAGGTVPDNFWRDYFGVMIALVPLIDATASSNTVEGDLVALGVAATVPLAAVGLDIVHVPRITLYGGELVVSHDPNGTRGALLLDVEVAMVVVLDLGGSAKLIDTDPQNPITVRYKAIGFATSNKPQVRDLVPVFDSSKGYSIKVPSSGGLKVPPPLGDILQVTATRIARSNPVNLELDLELKADLGVVSVDKMTIRIPLEGGHAPTITALGVHIDVSGAIEGSGYLAIYPDGFAGQLDVSLPGIGVRVAAGLSVRHVTDPNDASRTATAVLLTLEVDFPVPIALGNSGLGIYGFGGLFALHFRRDEHANDPVPALDWLIRVNGNPMDITGWTPEIDRWAIGLGALLGTMDAGFTLNVKGMLIFEMPGPRILLVMKAKIIWIRPPREGNPTATILAVIDIDLGRGRITIGLTFDYEIKPLLSIHLPVRAIFPFDDLPHFAIDVGTWYNAATVTFFDLFKARGYFMVRGKGLPDSEYDAGNESTFPLLPLGGFAIATGVSVSFLWGNRSSGLYLSVGASVDVGIGFSPIMFNGKLRLWGELHLWVIGIEASAQLTVIAGQVPDGPLLPDPEYPGDPTRLYQPTKSIVQIDGEVHGEIDMFFFTISGSVHVTLGDKPDSPPVPPPLVTGVSLQSRAAALLNGINSDRPIDGKLTDAHADGSAIPATEAVPIDAIIVIHFDCTPRVTGAFNVSQPSGATAVPIGIPTGPAAPAVRRGEPYYTYRIKSITLDNALTAGAVPIVWWPNVPKPDSEAKRELALLTRVPDPHPSAVERSKHAEDFLKQHWETVCRQVAPATPVLWTFHDAPLGPSSIGWILTGTAWPDPPDVDRASKPRLRLDVAETWRSGDPSADLMTDIAPARVIGGAVVCAEGCSPTRPDPHRDPNIPGVLALDPVRDSLRDALPNVSSSDQLASLSGTIAPNVQFAAARMANRGCHARVLEAPFLRAKPVEVFHGHPLGEVLADLFAAARDDDLDDVVAFSTRKIVQFRALLFLPRLVVTSGSLFMRCYDAKGTLLETLRIDGSGGRSHMVTTRSDLPKRWLDSQGPWHCRVEEVLTLLGVPSARQERGALAVLVDTNVRTGTVYVQFGVADVAKLSERGLSRASYLVGVIETLSAAEVEREDIETQIKTHQQSEVNGALGEMTLPPALLKPSTEYKVTVEWEYAVCEADGAVKDEDWKAGIAQPFRFLTDSQPLAPRQLEAPGEAAARTMPVRLDPWVLTTAPDEGERFYFHGQPIRIVFSVDYLLTMFATYGVTLEARVRAASFKNSSPASPNFAATKSDLIDVFIATDPATINTKPLKGATVFTPWEGMIRDVLVDQPCINASGDVTRQTIVDLNLLLVPRTDFILDIEDANAPAPAAGTLATPLFRRFFATSRYADAEEMCADVSSSQVTEMPATAADIADLVALVGAPAPRSPAAIDAALRKAGLRPVVDVTDPEIEILWVPEGGAQQPRVIVLRTPEPLVRVRKELLQYAPPGQPRLQREVMTLVDKPYLEVVQTPGVAGAPTMQVISQPGLNLVVVVIDAGRNKPIALSVRRHDNPLLGEGSGSSDINLLKVTLDAAMWELT